MDLPASVNRGMILAFREGFNFEKLRKFLENKPILYSIS